MTDTTFSLVRNSLAAPVRRWRTRRQLGQIIDDSGRLADIGISRREALAEIRKPFWEI